MKDGWEKLTLETLLERRWILSHLDGNHGSDYPKKEEFVSDGVPYISANCLQDDLVDMSRAKFLSPSRASLLRKGIAKDKDVLFAHNATVGPVAILRTDEEKVVLGTSLTYYRCDGSHILPEYLAHYMRSSMFTSQYVQVMGQSTRNQVPITKQREFFHVIPPVREQQRISIILDEAFEGIATAKTNAEKNLQNARALFESHLQSVFTQRGEGWVKNRLKSITTKIGSGATPRGGEESYKAEGISLIRSLNVHDLGFKYAKLAFLDAAQADELSNVEVQPRDVLLNITGASVARCTIVPEDVIPARVNQHVSIIRPIADKLDANFLHYTLISKPYKDELLKTGEEGGSTRQAITKAQIQEFSVEYPATLREQKAIVARLDAMLAETQRLATIYERKLAALDELKKSLLHQAFSGKL
jgi:type I restriction enzyme S subunit